MVVKLLGQCKFVVGIDEVGRAARKRASLAPHIKYIIGIDEVGRGPLAGPVTVAAVCVKRGKFRRVVPLALKDSKKLTLKGRLEWFEFCRGHCERGRMARAVSSVGERTIDKIGIVRSAARAVRRVLKRLKCDPEKSLILLDAGLKAPKIFQNQKTFIRGDSRIPIIALASIVAKVTRDRKMSRLAKIYPEYGFEQHKGYGTRAHYRALKKHGPSPLHRRSYLK